jgi:putative transcriptional regulator
MIRHHPDPALLVDYAAGGLAEPVALVAAGHLAYCAACRAEVRRLEAIGGAMVQALAPAEMAEDALATTLARVAKPEPARPPEPRFDAATLRLVPPPLRPYLRGGLSELPWRRRTWSLTEARLDCAVPGYRVSLVRLPANGGFPRHAHLGREYTLVLSGSYADDHGRYQVGDVESADRDLNHALRSEEGCLCLVVLDAGVRFTGLLGALVNRLAPKKF